MNDLIPIQGALAGLDPARLIDQGNNSWQYSGSVIFPSGTYRINQDKFTRGESDVLDFMRTYQALFAMVDGDLSTAHEHVASVFHQSASKASRFDSTHPGWGSTYGSMVAGSFRGELEQRTDAIMNRGYHPIDFLIMDQYLRVEPKSVDDVFEHFSDDGYQEGFQRRPVTQGDPILRNTANNAAKRYNIQLSDFEFVDSPYSRFSKNNTPHEIQPILNRFSTNGQYARFGSNGTDILVHSISGGREMVFVTDGNYAIDLQNGHMSRFEYIVKQRDPESRANFRMVDCFGSHGEKEPDRKTYQHDIEGFKYGGAFEGVEGYYPKDFALTFGFLKLISDVKAISMQHNQMMSATARASHALLDSNRQLIHSHNKTE